MNAYLDNYGIFTLFPVAGIHGRSYMPQGLTSESWYKPPPLKTLFCLVIRIYPAHFITDKLTGRKRVSLRGTPCAIHKNLKRAQSSLAMQIRSEHIGFNSYLYRRKVPGVDNPRCPCGYISQNVKHMIMACPVWSKGRTKVWRKAKNRSFEAMMSNPEDIERITQWILEQGWIEQFRLAGEVEAQLKQREDSRRNQRGR